jgi:hypothetical protein
MWVFKESEAISTLDYAAFFADFLAAGLAAALALAGFFAGAALEAIAFSNRLFASSRV